jgi:hypothetical protein
MNSVLSIGQYATKVRYSMILLKLIQVLKLLWEKEEKKKTKSLFWWFDPYMKLVAISNFD